MDEYRNNSNFLTITLAGKSAHYRQRFLKLIRLVETLYNKNIYFFYPGYSGGKWTFISSSHV